MLEQARARGKDRIERQAGLLQGHCPKKGNIQVRAVPGSKSTGAVIQSFHGIERAELAPRVYAQLEFSLDPPRHYGLMISVVYNQCRTFGKAGGKLGLEPAPGHGRLCESRVVLGVIGIGEACGGKGALAIKLSRVQPVFGCAGRD